MPLQQRVIEPVNVSRSTLPLPPGDVKPLIKSIAAYTGQGLAASAAASANVNIVHELECVTNGTLANLIRQLSSLSRQAEELLTGVFEDASKILSRTVDLQQKMDALAMKVEALDQVNDLPITLRDPTKHPETFSSDMSYSQQVLSKDQMPPSIAELYRNCDKPPSLNKLDPYRDDGKDGLKFYTDPTYFFELWKKDMMSAQQSQQSMVQSQILHHHGTLNSRTLRSSQVLSQTQAHTKQLQVHPNQQHQQPQQIIYVQPPHQHPQISQQQLQQPMRAQGQQLQHPSHHQMQYEATNRARPQNSQLPANVQAPSYMQEQLQTTGMNNLPPPPPALSPLPAQMESSPPPPPALSPLPPPMIPPNEPPAPPAPPSPPPPPPPPAPPAPSQPSAKAQISIQPPTFTAAQLQHQQQQLRKAVPVQRDPRSDLLAAIKQGITLRRVEDSKRRVEAEKQQTMGNDVASILARRVAMQVSDSDDNDEDGEDDNDWEDSSNC